LAAVSGRLGDEVAARREARFVGRVAEQDLFATVLAAEHPGFAVLGVVGVGGVGKSALLRVWRREAEAQGRSVRLVDGHLVDPNPAAFRDAVGDLDDDPVVLMVDTYELLQPLDDWLRDEFVANLPVRSIVVLAGRQALSTGWSADPGWRDFVRVVPLGHLAYVESARYLTDAGVPPSARPALATATRGHPLALGLAVDVLAQRGGDQGAESDVFLDSPEIVAALVNRFVADVPDERHRVALTAAVIARFTTEESLRAATGDDDVRAVFDWLRGLSCVEVCPRGLYPHDLARDVLDADLRWRDEDRHRLVWSRVRAEILRRIRALRGPAQRDAIFDLFFTIRNDPVARPIWRWESLGAVVPEPVEAQDRHAVLSLVERLEGPTSARWAAHWMDRQPAGFHLYSLHGEVAGFCAYLRLTAADAVDIAADPVTAAVGRLIGRRGGLGPGEELLINRFRIDRAAYQGPSHVQDLVSVLHFQHATRPELRWDVQVLADLRPFLALARIGFHPAPGPGPVVDGREYGLLVRDAVSPHPMWDAIRADRPPLDLSPDELTSAVRAALRHLHRPDVLARSPLCRVRSVMQRGGGPDAVRAVLVEAAERLRDHPREARLYRALDRTYLRPAANQEAAAEVLGLPMTTYRRHLTHAVVRVAELVGVG
jgi:hypothetical protein